MVRTWLIAAVLFTLALLCDSKELWMLCEAKSTRAKVSAQAVQLTGRTTKLVVESTTKVGKHG
eukprot:COSAG02_NODE_892_length_16138_cov_14.599875_8_plen_63_part_00